ncbi:MAG: class II aldolase/adducin family protein [Pseudolabrys sp.]|nr:class II aldolase/adducin family protein [Pseudolabrys sp.]MBV9260806.1 class II aldolase/adducin family protein [Pseudolabrys sp.]
MSLQELRTDLALANRILDQEGVIDAFGHISVRHPTDPNRYLLSRSSAPGMVTPDRILEYTLDSAPVRQGAPPQYSERVIHGEIYKARPDVMSVCHHHSPNFMPLVITGTDYTPVFHLGASGGVKPPFWDQYEEFGATNLLVVKPEEGASLARRLGPHWMVLMNRHGVTVAGTSIRDCVFRCIHSHYNADYQVRAALYGKVDPLRPGENEKCFGIATGTTGQTRAWELWVGRLAAAGVSFAMQKTRAVSAAKSKATKRKKTTKKRH